MALSHEGNCVESFIFNSKMTIFAAGYPPRRRDGEHPAKRKVDDLVVLLEFLMENDTFGC